MMVKSIQDWPQPIQRKWRQGVLSSVLLSLAGMICYLTLQDRILLFLTLSLILLLIAQSAALYFEICFRGYEEVEGICIETHKAPLRRQRSFIVQDDQERLYLGFTDKAVKLSVGSRYRLYYLSGSLAAELPAALLRQQLIAIGAVERPVNTESNVCEK